MKNLISFLVVLSFVLISTLASAQTTKAWVEGQAAAAKVDGAYKLTPRLNMYAERDMGHGFGAFAYGLAMRDFGEIYAGPTYAPAKWLQVGIGAGMETNGAFRSGGFIWAGGEKAYAIGFGELNAHGEWWYKGIAAWTPTKYLGAGAYAQRFMGVGPYLEVKIQNQILPITLWAAPVLYDAEADAGSRGKSLIGLRAIF